MTLEDRILETEQKFNTINERQQQDNQELLMLKGEYRLLERLKAELIAEKSEPEVTVEGE